ncbi:F-box/kelch-repeat protein [Senna tora]|uniref:F-box/kelch-repeat protein n=1 Tax=Senna tora TaxID=362788 RepID=A0A834TTL7_9FABA|nr:F-box/kelch-repeat protein [Senna tora]
MEDIFSNGIGIPSVLMADIFSMVEPEDIPKLPYVSKNWFDTCKRSSFIDNHCDESRKKKFKHMLFCVLEKQEQDLPFFLQMSLVVNDERTMQSFACLPSFFSCKEIKLVGTDEGFLCFLTKHEFDNEYFWLWNPVTHQIVNVALPSVISPGALMRYGFGFERNNGEFVIVVMWDSCERQSNVGSMAVYSSFSRTWSDVSSPEYCPQILFDSSIHINGCVYWISMNKDTSYGNSHVVVGLGVVTWFNVSALHKTYVIWLSRRFDCGEIGWVQYRRLDYSPSILRFLDFAGGNLVCISEQMQFYDEDEHCFTQGLIFFESEQRDIIRMMTSTYLNKFTVRKIFPYYPTIRVI